MKRVLLLLCFLMMSFNLFASIDNFSSDLNGFISCSEGEILRVNLNNVEIKGGTEKGFYKGRKVVVYRKSAPIYHPVTKELITTRKIKIAEGIIESADENISIAGISNLIGSIDPKTDVADCKSPLQLKFINETPSEESDGIISILKSKLNNNKNIIISDIGEFTVGIKLSKNDIEVELKNSAGDTLKNFIYPKSGKITLSRDIRKIDVTKTDELKSNFHSLTAFYYMNESYVAVSDEKSVNIFKQKDGKLINVGIVFPGFVEITNIESYDIDGDGNDEIVVSNIDKNLKPQSSFLKFAGNKLNNIYSNLPYLFRTVYDGKTKHLLYQKVKNSKLSAEIFKFSKVSNMGRDEDLFMKSDKFNIYNMGLGDINNDGKDDIIYINGDKKILILSEEKEIYKSVDNYGQGAHYFLLDLALKDKEKRGYSDKDDQLELRKSRYYVFPRLFVKDGQIFVYNNNLKFPLFPLRELFDSSKLERISYNNMGIVKKWQSDTLEPRIVDIYFNSDGKDVYLLVLKNISKGLLKKDNSEIMLLNMY